MAPTFRNLLDDTEDTPSPKQREDEVDPEELARYREKGEIE